MPEPSSKPSPNPGRRRSVLLLNPPGLRPYARDKYCTSISKGHYYWPQVDLLALSGRLFAHHRVGMIDAIADLLSTQQCLERARQEGYDAVVMLTCQASWQADFAFARRLKQELGLQVIVNGGFLLTRGEEALQRFSFLDAVMLDFTTDDLLPYLAGELDRVQSFIFRQQDEVVVRPRRDSRTFAYPVPRHELFPLERYRFPMSLRQRYTVALTSMGCAHRCAFCVPGTLGLQLREPDNVLAELRRIRELGIREVLFQDPCFAADREHTSQILRGMQREQLGLGWICQTRVDLMDEELLALMRAAGCHTIQFGVESGDAEVLRRAGKGITPADVERAFGLCRRHGLRTAAFFLLGLPGDTEQSILRTIELATRLGCDAAAFSLPMPHHGTRLGQQVAQLHGGPDLWHEFDEVSRPQQSLCALSPERLWELRNLAYRRFYLRPSFLARWALRMSNPRQISMGLRTMGAVLGKSGLVEWLPRFTSESDERR